MKQSERTNASSASRKQELKAIAAQVWSLCEEMNPEPFDGFVGCPPRWVPVWHLTRFFHVRDRLVRMYGKSQAHQWFKCHWALFGQKVEDDKLGKVPPTDRFASAEDLLIPVGCFDALEELAKFYEAVLKGEGAGLYRLAGEHAVQGRKRVSQLNAARESTHGTSEQRACEQSERRLTFERIRSENPKWTKGKVLKRTSEVCKTSVSSIRRSLSQQNTREK